MENRIKVIWKVLFIVILILVSLVPFYFMQHYAQAVINEQSTLHHLAAQSANYLSGLMDSVQGQSTTQPMIDLKSRYQFAFNHLQSAPLTLGLVFLWLLVIDVINSSRLSLVSYLLVGVGLVLFYLVELVFARYVQPGFAFFIPAIIFALLLSGYVTSALRNVVAGTVFGIGLLLIYTLAFYLVSEIDNILMYGAICLVVAFVVVIIMTRHIDWNAPAERVKGGAKKLN